MVTRTFPDSKSPVLSQLVQNDNPGSSFHWVEQIGPQSYGTGSVTYTDRDKAIDFRRLIKEGKDATTTAVGWKRKWEGESTFLLGWTNLFGDVDYVGQQAYDNTSLAHTASHLDSANQLAIGKFIRSCREAQHAFQAGPFLGELGQTIRFLASPVRSVTRLTNSYFDRVKDRAKWSGSRRSKTKRLADAWLSYRFGALPLLHDIDSGMQELASYTVGRPPTQPVRASAEDSTSSVEATSGATLSYWFYNREVTIKTQTLVTIRGKVLIELPKTLPYTGFQKRIIEDFVPTMWEVMPWSWAVDYFTNIGDVLSALTYMSSNIAWSNRTRRTSSVRSESVSYRPTNHPSVTYVSSKGRKTKTTYTLWNRESVSTNSLVPSLVFKTPTGSVIKLANLAAVAFQRFR